MLSEWIYPLKRLSYLVEKVAWLTVLIGGIGLLLSMSLGVIDVVSTYFNHPVPGAYELTESTMVLVVFGGLTYAQIRRKHIRVELVYQYMAPRVQSAMDIVAGLVAAMFFGFLVWQAWNEALYSLSIDESTSGLIRFPLWPARIVLTLGASMFILQILIDLLDDVHRLITNQGGREEDLVPSDVNEI